MGGLLAETVLAQRVSLDSIAERHPMLRYSAMMNDQDLTEHMRGCEVWGAEDFGGFKLHAGKDEFGRPCLWIENGMRGWPSVIVPMPGDDQ